MAGGQDEPIPGTQNLRERGTSRATTKSTPTFSFGRGILENAVRDYSRGLGRLGQAVDNYEVAPFTADQLEGFDLARGVARGEGGYIPTALDTLSRTARGDYLYGGEGFDAAVDAAYRRGAPEVLSAFGRAGRFNNFLGSEALGRTFSDSFASQYGNERARQLSAAQLLPQMSLIPSEILGGIGGQQQTLAQAQRDARVTLPMSYLGSFAGLSPLMSPFYGTRSVQTGRTSGTTMGTETSGYFPGNEGAGILGGALTGLGLGSSMAPAGATGLAALGGPVGLGLGVAGGLLGGIFS